MALLNPAPKAKKKQIRISLNEKLLADIELYCKWRGFEKTDDFLEQAVQYVFDDKEWQKFKKENEHGK